MKTDIAHYSIINGLYYALFSIAIPGFIFGTMIINKWYFQYLEAGHYYWLPLLMFSWFAGGICLLFALNFLVIFFWRRRVSLWIEDGNLIYFHRWFMSTPCAEIASIRGGSYGPANTPGIVLQLHSGETKIIPSSAFAESREYVINQLRYFIRVTQNQSCPNLQ